MRHFKLPDGSYLNPAQIDRFEVKKHFMSKEYDVSLIEKKAETKEHWASTCRFRGRKS